MHFDFDRAQYALRDAARDLLRRVHPRERLRAALEDPMAFPRDAWRELAAAGFTGLLVPERWGGSGLTLLDTVLVSEEVGAALLPAPFLETAIWVVDLLRTCGTEAQQARWLPAIAAGECVATIAWLEEAAAWNADGVTLPATPARGRYRLQGRKLFVPYAHAADLIIVAARTHGRYEEGIALFAVDARGAGVRSTPLRAMDLTYRLSAVELDVEVEADAVVGDPRGGWRALAASSGVATVSLCAEMVGGMDRVLAMTTDYAKERQQFGRPIGSFQAIKHKLADMALETESARAATYYAAWAVSTCAAEAARAISLAKAYVSDAYARCAGEAIQIHGGIGFTWEHDIHLYFKRAKRCEFTLGGASLHRERLLQTALEGDAGLRGGGEAA